MPFLRFVEFYDFEARKASQSTPAQNDVPVIPPVQEQPANQLAELVDDTLEGNLPRRASSCFGSCFPSNRKDRNRAEAQRNGRNRGKPQRNGRNGLNLAEPQRSGRQGGEQTGAKGGIARPGKRVARPCKRSEEIERGRVKKEFT